MLAINSVNVLENNKPLHQRAGGSEPNQAGLDQWPILDSRGNTLDKIHRPKAKTSNEPERRGDRAYQNLKQSDAERNKINWRESTPETEDENDADEDEIDDEFSDDDDIDDDDGQGMMTRNNIGNSDRNYMYPQHDPTKRDPSKPPMMKFKPSLFSRNVLVIRAMKRLENRDNMIKEEENADNEDPKSAAMARKGEARVRSSKRRAQHLLRNQLAELSLNHEELLRENKILKQIQKRQEKELDRYTNAEEDIPRLLDANSFEIAGLKAKNKQLFFERRENEDKLRRQHQEIITLKDSNKKITNLANNKKLGEREKLEINLTTARVTISHQENRIQDLTKAVEIYKKNADRESKGSQLQLKKVQNNLRDLQDAYNDLFIKYKAKERESGDNNIYAQRIRKLKHTPSVTPLQKSRANLIIESINSTARSSPRRAQPKSSDQITYLKESSFEALKTKLESQSQSLVNLQEEIAAPSKSEDITEKMRPKTSSTLSSDEEIEESDAPVEEEEIVEEEDTNSTIPPPEVHIQKKETKHSVDVLSSDESGPSEDKRRLREVLEEKQRQAESLAMEKLKEEKRRERKLAELKEAEERKRQAEEVKKVEAARRAEQEKKEEERRKKEEAEMQKKADLLAEKKAKDEALKNKLAAMRNKAGGGDDFMSQMKAKSKKNTPTMSPLSTEETSPAQSEHALNKSGSGDNFRKNAVSNNASRLAPKVDDEGFTGYQPSFAGRRAQKKESIGDDMNNEYTPSFSNSQRISREKLNNTVEPLPNKSWTPVGKASSGGLFEDKHKPLMPRRSSSNRNVIATRNQSDDDLEELLL